MHLPQPKVSAYSSMTLQPYFFEVQEEDDYRKTDLSKERRLEPPILIGLLLVDQSGFPLALHSFEGNTAETNTILPVLENFKKNGMVDKSLRWWLMLPCSAIKTWKL